MLSQSGTILRKHAPPGSILFAEDARGPEGVLNYLPIAGDWDVFTVSAFSTQGNRMMMRGGGPMMQNQDNPSPMQPRRRQAMADLYRGKTSRDLSQDQGRIVDDALAHGRHVFIVGNASTLSAFRQNLPSQKKYDFITVDRWKDTLPPSGAEANRMLVDRGPNRRGFGGNFGPGRGGFGGPGMGPPGAMMVGGPMPPSEMNQSAGWQLIEVKLKPPAPTTLPVAQR
jgi:hypothetical protein